MSAGGTTDNSVILKVEPRPDREGIPVDVTAPAILLGIVAVISWGATLILNRSIAPRLFWARVVVPGALPVAMLFGLLISAELFRRGVSLDHALQVIARIPTRGWVMIFAMLVTGLLFSWLAATLRDRRDRRLAMAALESFE